MKKLISIIITILALGVLTVTAFAAEDADPAGKQEETAQIIAELSEEDALAAALEDAGELEANVTVTKNKLSEKETENGETVAVYTFKFNTDTTSYKYFVDAENGEILYKSIEYQNPDVVFKSRSDGEKKGEAEETKNASKSGSHENKKSDSKVSDEGGSEGSESEMQPDTDA